MVGNTRPTNSPWRIPHASSNSRITGRGQIVPVALPGQHKIAQKGQQGALLGRERTLIDQAVDLALYSFGVRLACNRSGRDTGKQVGVRIS